jgi:hypothetical protein
VAYREFHYEKPYERPRNVMSLQGLNDSVSALFKSVQEQKAAKQKKADAYEFTLKNGTDVNDDALINAGAEEVTATMRDAILNEDPSKISEARKLKDFWQQSQNQRNKQDQQFKLYDAAAKEKATADKNYDYTVDKKLIADAYFGENMNGEHNFTNRQDYLDSISGVIGNNPDALDINGYAKTYVSNLASDEIKGENAAADWRSKGVFRIGSKLGITDQHVMDFFGSREDGLAYRKIEKEVNQELLREAKQFKSMAPKETKGMSDQEVMEYLRDNPTDNPVDKNGFNTRILEKGRNLLSQAEETLKEYNRKEGETSSPSASANGSTITPSVSRIGPGGSETFALGFNVESKDPNKPLSINTYNSQRTDLLTGKAANKMPGQLNFKINKVALMPFGGANGATAYQWTSGSPEDMKKSIDTFPNSYFDPNGPVKLGDQLGVGIVGFTLDDVKTERLKDVQDKITELHGEKGAAKKKGDTAELERIEGEIADAIDLMDEMQNYNSETSNPFDIINGAKELGIKNMRNDQILKADDSDLASLSNKKTGIGVDMRKRDNWTPEMKEVAEYYTERAAKAKAAGYNDGKAAPKKTEKPKTISYKGEEYEVTPGRVPMIKPDGTATSIPEAQKELALSKGYKLME